MKTFFNVVAVVFLLSAFSCKPVINDNNYTVQRIDKNINQGWQFTKEDTSDGNWESVNLPHTPVIEPLIVNNQWQGVMWYKKHLFIGDKSKKSFLNFEGLMQDATLWINGVELASHSGGYLPFNIDITDFVYANTENEIKIKLTNVDNPTTPPGKPLKELDFNTYGGIYRDVHFIQTSKIYITDAIIENKAASGGVLVHFSEVSDKKASGNVKVHIRNDAAEASNLYCEIELMSPLGERIVFHSNKADINKGREHEFNIAVAIDKPNIWSIQNPNLYKVAVKLFANQLLEDAQILNIGIRKIDLKTDGFYLNNEKLFIRGTNRHQEYPYVGYAISNNANYRDAVKIKQAGFDLVRLSHYPHDNSFLKACDELGILVINAIPGWQFFGDSTFVENSYQNIRDMVHRDRNHASVIFWEVSLNESQMTDEYMVKANNILKQELPFHDTYSAGWMDHPSYDLFIPARQHAEPPHYWNNYKVNERAVFVAEYGDWEYYAQNAGFNQTAYENLKEEERTSRQLRGAGEKRLLQQAFNYQEAANSNRKGVSTIGHANWLMFDYNRGYADDIESSGISDIFRIPKFAFYFYQSQRSPNDTMALGLETGPMVKIASYYAENSDKNIRVFSNCDEVELYLNDKLVERKKADVNKYSDQLAYPPFNFELTKFEKGTLVAKGLINGIVLATDVVRTPETAANIEITVDESGIAIDQVEGDLLFVYAKIVDANGTLVPDYNKAISFSVEGAEIVGQNSINAEAGIATILIKTFGEGAIKISAGNAKISSTLML